MKRPVALALAIVISITGLTASPATAGLFDKLKKKAEDAVSDYAKDKAEEAVGIDTDQPEAKSSSSSTAAKSTSSSAGKMAAGDLPTEPVKIAKGILSSNPKLFEGRPEAQFDSSHMKDFVRVFFPDKNEELTNEFKWRKNKAAWQEEMVAQSKGAPTSFEVAPWINNGSSQPGSSGGPDFTFSLGRYDFDRKAWQMGASGSLFLPWIGSPKYAFVDYEVTNFDYNKVKNIYLPMSSDDAEKLDETLTKYGRALYARYHFTITDVIVDPKKHPGYKQYERDLGKIPEDRRNALIARRLPPHAVVKVSDKVELYTSKSFGSSKSRDDYTYVGTVNLASGKVTVED